MDTGRIAVTLEETDVVAAFRLHARKAPGTWLFYIVLSAAAGGLGGWILATPAFPSFMEVLGAIAIGATVLWWANTIVFMALLRRRLRRKIRERGMALGAYELDWDESGLGFENRDTSTRKPWPELVKWRRDKHVFLVYFTPRLFWIVPRRVFTDAAGEQDFEALLIEKIGPANRPRRRS